MNKKLIVTLGMHRSGTSALTRGLGVLGVDLGDRLMPSLPGVNEKGFWEDTEVVALNEEILHAVGSAWDAVSAISDTAFRQLREAGYLDRATRLLDAKVSSTPLFGLKDPRLCKLLPFWQEVFERCALDVRYVVSIRNPASVKNSLVRRDRFSPEKCYYIWLGHVLESITNARVIADSVIVDYDRLLANPDRELGKVASRFGLNVDPDALELYRSEFLESGLRHSLHDTEHLAADPACPPQVRELYETLLEVSDNSAALSDERLQRLAGKCYEEYRSMTPLLRWADTLTQAQRQHQADLDAAVSHAAEQANIGLRVELDGLRRIRRERGEEIEHLNALLKFRDRDLGSAQEEIARRDRIIVEMAGEIEALRGSTSWRMTRPLRALGTKARHTRQASKLFQAAAGKQGVLPATKGALSAIRQQGVTGLKKWLTAPGQAATSMPVTVPPAPSPGAALTVAFRPHYLDPFFGVENAATKPSSLAVHLYVNDDTRSADLLDHLANVPYAFDLFVSKGPNSTLDGNTLMAACSHVLPKARIVTVQASPEGAGALASLLLLFGERLGTYEYVGHFHTGDAKPQRRAQTEWGVLLGRKQSTGKEVAQILDLLAQEAKMVCAEGDLSDVANIYTRTDDRMAAAELLRRYTDLKIEDFAVDEFRRVSMFWARRAVLSALAQVSAIEQDTIPESAPREGAFEQALATGLPLLAASAEGAFVQLFERDSTDEYPFYEEQIDFSGELPSDVPKVLSYYLPQFHPIPENDEWHGVGFTEWTKVRAANPLFPAHYQQHIPHEDLGYYLLDTPVTLAKQADMMKRAGVHGQIFYHYWFGGKLILEKPARMLLDHPEIEMPFCFCWANENWTRRWDGEEHNVLLGQNYSPDDAAAFIRYLIPFFRDRRHIAVDGRPVLFVYRPSSMPDAHQYVRIWREECLKAGLPAPYVVAVLTRGATDPSDFGMDAGTERVLHDWTGGAVADISQSLKPYTQLQGRVIDYGQVADFYMSQSPARLFPYFRSLVPIWDNTARYGDGAYVVHGSTPAKFQEWLSLLVEQAESNLSHDKRFILVNAWNEWAEGAHLEPDTRHGYAYLNAVGRALTHKPIGWLPPLSSEALARLRIHIEIAPLAANALLADPVLKQRFVACLGASTLLSRCKVSVDSQFMHEALKPLHQGVVFAKNGEADHVLRVGDVSYFDAATLERLVVAAEVGKTSVILANAYGNGDEIAPAVADGSVSRRVAVNAPLAVYPASCGGIYKSFKVCGAARCFVAPPSSEPDRPCVTTIVRFHKSADFELLRNALWCLLAMKDCIVRPYIAAQDLSEHQKATLEQLLACYPWDTEHPPLIQYFESLDGQGDLRSVMLNESLKRLKSGYVAFLDYDDMLFPTAYRFLLSRLKQTGKSVTFGRVYASYYDSRIGRIVERRKIFEYGRSYADFIAHNHAPLHSFMLDLNGIDVDSVVYHEDQKYMEDYFLTLQIFSPDNTDWDVLGIPQYIGDYIHSVDRAHTLALADDGQRRDVARSDLYRKCEERILQMRKQKSALPRFVRPPA